MATCAVRERGMIFSGAMVRAILSGAKTQTRRVLNPQPLNEFVYSARVEGRDVWWECNARDNWIRSDTESRFAVGDRLWVCETWDWVAGTVLDNRTTKRFEQTVYKADGCRPASGKWKPSIHMPRWASRITLEITDVRVERLQSISAKDIIAEGAVERAHNCEHFGKMPVSAFDGGAYVDLISLWAAGWDSVNGKKHPFASNPWCWVISFKRVSP
jgi:hypothetical protein